MSDAVEINPAAKALHDLLLASASPEAHPPGCAFCQTPEETTVSKTPEEIQAEVDAAVATAVAAATGPLLAQIKQLEADAQAGEQASEIENLKAQVADLQAKLDVAVADATATKAEADAIVAYLADVAAENEAKAEHEAAKATRAAEVTKLGVFPEDYVTANADRWAGYDEADWNATLAEYKAIATAKGSPADPVTPVIDPVTSPLTATSPAPAGDATKVVADLKAVLSTTPAARA